MASDVRILALETSSRRGSIALLQSTQVVAQHELTDSTRSAQSLIPAINEALQSLGWNPKEIEMVAVTSGPGSFTGLRVGVTAAKTFAYATGADVVAVDTLDCIAARVTGCASRLHVVIDAQRGDFFAAAYEFQRDGQPQVVESGKIVAQSVWLSTLKPGDAVTGSGLPKLKDPLPAGVETISEQLWQPLAADVGRLALAKYQLGHRDDLWTLCPIYYRKSAAEEKLADQSK
jgi:tRNA threonylcarbamoyladenosine biosynthesis protein TsaB